MKMLHYPPQTGEIDPRVIGIGAHTEYAGFLLVLDWGFVWFENVLGREVL